MTRPTADVPTPRRAYQFAMPRYRRSPEVYWRPTAERVKPGPCYKRGAESCFAWFVAVGYLGGPLDRTWMFFICPPCWHLIERREDFGDR